MNASLQISYKVNAPIRSEELAAVFNSSGIKRPYEDLPRLQKMIDNADIIITAWNQDQLIGIARAITDYSYCCYLSDLAVDRDFQQKGIGKKLIQILQDQLDDHVSLLLLSAPSAIEYYPQIGFNKVNNGFIIPRKK